LENPIQEIPGAVGVIETSVLGPENESETLLPEIEIGGRSRGADMSRLSRWTARFEFTIVRTESVELPETRRPVGSTGKVRSLQVTIPEETVTFPNEISQSEEDIEPEERWEIF
jgi:hypothetical protein